MKRIFILTAAFIFCFNFSGFSQNLDYNQKLPIDSSIKKGVLPNGMTYYIKSTDVVKDAASYYIIQNVGSVLENEDQQGLAHFLEHMAFNGTENFPGKGILNTLQKHGAVFGKDINAYTSFDETVYNLSNIPTKNGLVDTCLTVLRDWSNYLLLTDEEIDAERGVIKEEWRTRQSGRMRLFQTSLPVTFNKSKYADRLPIGLMSVVEGFEYKALRDFYHDWYRTDLQAIAVIGDVDVNEIETKIVSMFSSIPAVENPKERIVIEIPDNEAMLFSLGTDPEVSTSSINLGIRHKRSADTETVNKLRNDLLESMATSIISERLSEKAQDPEANFLGARVGYRQLARTSNEFYVAVSPKPNKQKEAFQEVFEEVIRAIKFGYLQSEIDRSKSKLINSYENQIAQKDDQSHRQIEYGIQSNYLNNSPLADIEKEFEIAKQILQTVTDNDLHNTIKSLYTVNNRYINVAGVEGRDNLTEAEAKQIISAAEQNEQLKQYKEALAGKTLVSGIDIKSGSITKETSNDETGATTFTLSNGVKVHYKFSDKEKDQVALNAVSYGGTSLLEDVDLPSAAMVGDLSRLSGLGEFNATELKKVMAGKTANVRFSIDDIDENLYGNSNTKDVETMLQLAHLHFVKPRFDEQAFKVLESNINNYLLRRSKNVNEIMKDSLTVTIYGENNPKERIFNQEFLNDVSFQKIESIYKDRFSDASDFEFFIVGDVKEEQLKPLLEKYIASLPTNSTSETYKDNAAQWVSSDIVKDIFIKMEDPKASVNVTYKNDVPYSIANSIYTTALGDILQLRVTETVREAEGGAYSPRAYATLYREPSSRLYVSFRFDCNPDMADNLVNIVNSELQKIANGNIIDADLEKTRTNFIKEREQAKDKNGYDMQVLTSFFRYDENINDPKNFENIVKAMSKEDIQSMANQALENGSSYQVIFKPLK